MSSRSKLLPPLPGVLAASLVLCAGCKTTNYTLQVDAISQSGAAAEGAKEPHSYKVHSRNPRNDEDTLRYNEVASYVKTALSGKGMYEAPTAEGADLIIEIDYGMETPRMKYETVTTPVIRLQEGRPQMVMVPVVSATGTITYKQVTVQTPPVQRIVGWKEEAEPVVVYEKYLKVSARENKEATEGRAPPEVWSVNVSAEDQSNEMRKYLPILASATADYIGTNTKQEKEVAVSERDESVKFIKKGM